MLSGALGGVQELVDGGGKGSEGGPQHTVCWREWGEHLGQAWTEQAEVDTAAEEGRVQTCLSRPIALGARRACDQTVQQQATQVVGDASGRQCARAQACGMMIPQVSMAKATWQEGEAGQGATSGLAPEGRRSAERPHVGRRPPGAG
jgi:hypothetical protein